MSRVRLAGLVLAVLTVLGLVLGGLGVSGWVLAEEAGMAPPLGPAVRAAADQVGSEVPLVVESAAPEPELRPRCPATLLVETEEGDPVVGEVRLGDAQWATLDQHGETPWPHRPCGGRPSVWLRGDADPPGGRLFRVPFDDSDVVVLRVGARGEAWVRPVDTAGAPVAAHMVPGTVEEDGLLHVVGRGETARVRAFVEGEVGGTWTVPLDGEVHALVVPRDRRVRVTLHCDQCAGRVVCDNRWQGLGPACVPNGDALDCICPAQGTSTLLLRTPDALLDYTDHVQPLAAVEEHESSVVVDVRGEVGAVSARVDPDALLGGVTLRRPGSLGRFVPDDGGVIEADGLLPGDWELVLGRQHVVPFTLDPAQQVDLGWIAL